MNVNGIVVGASLNLEQPLDYRYTLYDTNGNEVNDPSGEHIVYHSSSSGEWATAESLAGLDYLKNELRYASSPFAFGPAESDWGTVDQMRVEVQLDGDYHYLGAVKLGSNGYNISQGEAIVLDSSSNIDFSGSSDLLSTFPSSLDGLLKSFLEYTDNSETRWSFTLDRDDGAVHDSVYLSLPSSIIWSISSNALQYEGPTISWRKPESSFTGGLVRVSVNMQNGESYEVGTSNLSSPSIGRGDSLELQDGNLTISP